jgi:uncharacterized membrane protein YoaK (UPF0700 family)
MAASRRQRRTRDVLLILLALTAGACDATAFEHIGGVFASVITGNLVLLGVSAVHAGGGLARFAGCSLGGYALGVIATAWACGQREERALWPASATLALALDLVLLALFALGWEWLDAAPGATAQLLLLATMAAAMGAQSTAVRRIGQVSTTYLTSTLTGLLEALISWRLTESDARSVGILLAALTGAAAATLELQHAPHWLPVAQLLPLAIVLLASTTLSESGAPPREKQPRAQERE